MATSLTPTQDTPVTDVYIFTGGGVLKIKGGRHLHEGRRGVEPHPGSTGDDLSIVTSTGGTGAYAGATGRLRASGTFSEAGGEFSSYEGELCTP